MKLKLVDTYVFNFEEKNILIRYEVFVDANKSHNDIAKILVTQESPGSTDPITLLDIEDIEGAGEYKGYKLPTNPLRVEHASEYCSALNRKNYGKDF